MGTYDHKKIEKKWRKRWEDEGTNNTGEDSSKKKLYVLDMFPYPSGSGLHTGHVEGYAATDIYSRFKRMQGFNVLHPMGWDAFGLPAENYAIKTKTPPLQTTNKAIDTFREQIKSLGLSYDWSREIGTHTPEYYKWTQWFFLFLFKNGLAEKKMGTVNWCPNDQTVLANEQTVSESGEKGVCVRCGTKVIQRDLAQWFFKITDFADDLIDGLDDVDWPESTKVAQRNWIGRSEGAEISFSIEFEGGQRSEKIPVFTTRPDTLFGATYMVLAPEHHWITLATDNQQNVLKNKEEVEKYITETKSKTDIERTAEGREKSGIKLEGVWAINPATGEKIPIYIADYVLVQYGTGVVMGVPAHDQRDHMFAKKYQCEVLPVIQPPLSINSYSNFPHVHPFHVEEGADIATVQLEKVKEKIDLLNRGEICYTGKGKLMNSGIFTGMNSEEAKNKITEFVTGKIVRKYRLRDWLVSRQRYWGAPIPIVYDPEGKAHPVPEKHLPWLLPTDVEFLPKGTSPLGTSKELVARVEKIFGAGWKPEIDTLDTFVCSSWYYFRFADPHNSEAFASKEAIQKWLPVDLYMGGAEHTVLHLMYARFFTKALERFGHITFTEPFLKLRHQGMILAADGTKMSKSKGDVINPDTFVSSYGADTVRVYEMFMGPLEAMKPWNTENIIGSRRFLERAFRLEERIDDSATLSSAAVTVLNQTIKKIGEDIENLSLNTAISQMMICLNAFEAESRVSSETYATFLKLLSPFAPFLTEELWEKIGHTTSIHAETWPAYDVSKLEKDEVSIAVQIAGKTRGLVTTHRNASEMEVLGLIHKDEKLMKFIPLTPQRIIFVPGRIINLIP